MNQQKSRNCPTCGMTLLPNARFCPQCGGSVATEAEPDEILIASNKRLRISQDTLNVRELMAIIESGVYWWEQKLQQADGMAREHAAAAIQDLSLVLESLSQQLLQGRETIRITARLPTTRAYSIGCPVCGHGNREGAKFCRACGTLLPATPASTAPSPSPRLNLRVASRSDLGKMRQNNEDTCFTGTLRQGTNAAVYLLLIADGMGGAQAGEVASSMASETMQRTVRDELKESFPASPEAWQTLLQKAATNANQRIYAQASTHESKRGMGTTLTVLAVVNNDIHMAHVGDSRAYLINPNGVTEDGAKLMQMSNDHTLVARLVDIGQLTPEEARNQPQSNMLYRALGTEAAVEVDTMSLPLQPDDVLLLCSDGLTAHVNDMELEEMALSGDSPDTICDRLVALANERGGRDNISVIVAKVEEKEKGALPINRNRAALSSQPAHKRMI